MSETVTIRPKGAAETVEVAEDAPHDPDCRWFADAAPAARSPFKGKTRVGMR